MASQKLYCYGLNGFTRAMQMNGWTDGTLPDNVAIISICCTDTIDDNTEYHYFKTSGNVLNIEFDDLDKDVLYRLGPEAVEQYEHRCMTDEQAKQMVEFILRNKDKNFYVHCSAGVSRSQAVIKFIHLNLSEDKNQFELNPNNSDYSFANGYVYSLLTKYYRNYVEL